MADKQSMAAAAILGAIWAGSLMLIQLRHIQGASLAEKEFRKSLRAKLDRTDAMLFAVSAVSFVLMLTVVSRLYS